MVEEKRKPYASFGDYIAWLQREMLVNRRCLTNEGMCSPFQMSSSTFADVKKGVR